MVPTLETARLRLRPFTMDDLDRAYEQFDTHPDVWRYDPGYPPSRDQRRRWMVYRIQELQMHGFGCLAVELKETGELIGTCGLEFNLRPASPYRTPRIELYYRLGRDYWGHGYATEAVRETIRHAFEDLKLERILAHAARENKASIALLERVGFHIVDDPYDKDEMLGVLDAPKVRQ